MGATLGTWLLTWLRGEPVGPDEYGNRYYRLKNFTPLAMVAEIQVPTEPWLGRY